MHSMRLVVNVTIFYVSASASFVGKFMMCVASGRNGEVHSLNSSIGWFPIESCGSVLLALWIVLKDMPTANSRPTSIVEHFNSTEMIRNSYSSETTFTQVHCAHYNSEKDWSMKASRFRHSKCTYLLTSFWYNWWCSRRIFQLIWIFGFVLEIYEFSLPMASHMKSCFV